MARLKAGALGWRLVITVPVQLPKIIEFDQLPVTVEKLNVHRTRERLR